MRVNKNSRTVKDQEWIAQIFKDFQDLESLLSNFKGFQHAYEPSVPYATDPCQAYAPYATNPCHSLNSNLN